MKAAVMFSATALLAFAVPADAQYSQPQPTPKTWATAWLGGFVNPGRVFDPASNSTWDFGSAFSGGLGLHRNIGDALSLGIEASYAPASFERRDPNAEDNPLIEDGSAGLATTMLTARLRTGGGGSFGMYLTGGAGALFYRMPTLKRWDPDLALMTGAGLEYRASANKTLFVEWGRFWTFHQSEGVEDNSTRMSQLRGGVRIGF